LDPIPAGQVVLHRSKNTAAGRASRFIEGGANGGGRTHMAVNRWNLNAIKGLAYSGVAWRISDLG